MASFAAENASPLPPVERKAILTLLDEFTSALAIYHGSLEKPAKHDDDISIDCLPDGVDELKMFNADEIREIEEARRRAISAKVYANSLCTRRIMEELKEEIRSSGTFRVLETEIDKLTLQGNEGTTPYAEEQKVRETALQLERLLSDERAFHEGERKRISRQLAEEQRNAEKLRIIKEAELRYAADWGKARCEQIALRCDSEAKNLEKLVNERRARENDEQRVHHELAKFLTQETAALDELTQQWEERYRLEKGAYEKEIRELRIRIATRRKELNELKEEYRRNQAFIDKHLAEKEAAREERERLERMEKGAIRIQAWWRGVMVRRKLGPHRPAEKRKKRQAKTKK